MTGRAVDLASHFIPERRWINATCLCINWKQLKKVLHLYYLAYRWSWEELLSKINETFMAKMSGVIAIFNETSIVLLIIWSIMFLMFINTKDADCGFQLQCQFIEVYFTIMYHCRFRVNSEKIRNQPFFF